MSKGLSPVQRAALAAGPALTAAAVAAVILVRRRRTPADPRSAWSCECGRRYLVQGSGRHRVYWLPDADRSDPLLGRECVNCGAPFPSGHAELTRAG